MINCILRIHTKSKQSSVFQTKAEFEPSENGGRVVYRIEGDEGEIVFGKERMRMIRKGDCNLSANFKEGEESNMLLTSDGSSGEIPLVTTSYFVQKIPEGYFLSLRYSLNNFDRSEKFHLKIKVLFSEEK